MPSVDISLVFRVTNCVAAAFMAIGGVGTIIREFSVLLQQYLSFVYPLKSLNLHHLCFLSLDVVHVRNVVILWYRIKKKSFSFFKRYSKTNNPFHLLYLALNYSALAIAAGVIVILIGVVYCVLHFVPGVQAPTNMQRSAFEESLGYSTRPLDQGGAYPAGSSPAATYNSGSYNPPASNAAPGTGGYDSGSFPTKTYVSDGPTV
ncbi:hypothetical protein INT45_005437 [Circinella minor]|uniref:Uncharacterized protein n=1 Tax=Circinella minor TaxID=1195481 RepID=A0A8H7VBY1_9FUNG|nr:hypothetical protein INT45_005437 [Circinella minor]